MVNVPSIDSYITAQVELAKMPGVGVSVRRHGEIVHERGYGYADVEQGTAMSENSPVVIGSTTKAMTAAAILQLAEQGRLTLDDTVQSHLPDFTLADPDAASLITIRQVLSHTAGLPPTPIDAPTFAPAEAPSSNMEYIAELATVEPVWAPGAGWLYANDGYVLAGRIVEVVSGQPFASYMAEHLFRPLGMKTARFAPSPGPDGDLATPYDYDASGKASPSFVPFDPCYAQGMAIMSAHDSGRWLQTMLDGGVYDGQRVLTEARTAELLRPLVPACPPGGTAERMYGLGWGTSEANGLRLISHGGSAITMGSMFILAPDEGLTVAVLANSGTSATSVIAQGILNLMLGKGPSASFPTVNHQFQPDRSSWPRLVGEYRATTPQNSISSPLPIQIDGDHLVAHTYPGTDSYRPGDTFLVPVDGASFMLYGRGRTGLSAEFDLSGDEVRGTMMGAPIVKFSAPVHGGTVLRWE